ncbi:hypothetical protein I79_007647 [Cricetulus griseus]|uniref:Uncharacterized protein n=1 Tax=Cricetulus griseus TaxID=10029 RepID=G3HB32_CRIGR|nr:hypothetical protein I79_007647 [Cricetulus griseus]
MPSAALRGHGAGPRCADRHTCRQNTHTRERFPASLPQRHRQVPAGISFSRRPRSQLI